MLLSPDEPGPTAHLGPGGVEPDRSDGVAQALDIAPGVEAAGGLDPGIDQPVGGSRRLAPAGREGEGGQKTYCDGSLWITRILSLPQVVVVPIVFAVRPW